MHPAVGEIRNYRGQLYKCIDAFPHVMRDGRSVMLLVIKSRCSDCCRTFEITETVRNFHRRKLLRRCEDCRKPGVPVGPVRRRREKSNALIWMEEEMWRVLVELAMAQRDRVLPGARGWVRNQGLEARPCRARVITGFRYTWHGQLLPRKDGIDP